MRILYSRTQSPRKSARRSARQNKQQGVEGEVIRSRYLPRLDSIRHKRRPPAGEPGHRDLDRFARERRDSPEFLNEAQIDGIDDGSSANRRRMEDVWVVAVRMVPACYWATETRRTSRWTLPGETRRSGTLSRDSSFALRGEADQQCSVLARLHEGARQLGQDTQALGHRHRPARFVPSGRKDPEPRYVTLMGFHQLHSHPTAPKCCRLR